MIIHPLKCFSSLSWILMMDKIRCAKALSTMTTRCLMGHFTWSD